MQRVTPFAILVLTALCTAAISRAASAEPQFPVGVRIGLEPPAGMVLSKTFPGFDDVTRKAAITILDLPAGVFEEVQKRVMVQELGQPGVTVDKRETFPFESGIGYLVAFRLQTDGKTVYRWFLLAASPVNPAADLTALVTVEVPEEERGVYTDAVIRGALATITFRPRPVEEQLGQLPFRLTEFSGFRLTRVFPMTGVLLTAGPRDDDATGQPHVAITVSAGGPQQADDRPAFARRMLQQATPVTEIAVTAADPMRISGQPGYEIRADGRDPAGRPVSLVQWLRFGGGGFLRIVAVSGKSQWDEFYPRFRAIRDGIGPQN